MLNMPDHSVAGISMTEGKLVGLGNLFRRESAMLEERTDKVYLTCMVAVEKVVASYMWRRNKLR